MTITMTMTTSFSRFFHVHTDAVNQPHGEKDEPIAEPLPMFVNVEEIKRLRLCARLAAAQQIYAHIVHGDGSSLATPPLIDISVDNDEDMHVSSSLLGRSNVMGLLKPSRTTSSPKTIASKKQKTTTDDVIGDRSDSPTSLHHGKNTDDSSNPTTVVSLPYEKTLCTDIVKIAIDHLEQWSQKLQALLSDQYPTRVIPLLAKAIILAAITELTPRQYHGVGLAQSENYRAVVSDYVVIAHAFFDAKQAGFVNAVIDCYGKKWHHEGM